MNLFARSIIIWLTTNILGSAIIIFFFHEGSGSIESYTNFFGLFLMFGGLFSLPAIPFTYLNLRYISRSIENKESKYLYLFFSTLLFIVVAVFTIMYTMSDGNLRLKDVKEAAEMLWAHTLMAILTTIFFASGIINLTAEKKENPEKEIHI
jgi:hypothetical protein